jgi:branched-chain amino acid transport system ATP-binding protein
MPDDLILETRDVSKEFRGFVAVNGVSIRVRRGSIHGLIGPNGAGKTTMFNLLTRFLPVTRGTILHRGEDVTRLPAAAVARRGVVRSFQISAVFPTLTALENVRIALQRPLGTSFRFWAAGSSLRVLDGRARELLAEVDLEKLADVPAGEVLLLDEPTAGMGHEDVGRVAALIRRVGAGRTVLMVEHNLSVVADLCDTITVLARGSVLAEGSYATVSTDPAVREAYIGSAA